MTEEQFQQIAKTVADPSRLSALELIARKGEVSCSAIAEHLALSAATVSHHVKELSTAELVQSRKEAKFHYFRFNSATWNAYLKELEKRFPKLPR